MSRPGKLYGNPASQWISVRVYGRGRDTQTGGQLAAQDVALRYIVTDGDAHGVEGVKSGMSATTSNVERQADTTHLEQSLLYVPTSLQVEQSDFAAIGTGEICSDHLCHYNPLLRLANKCLNFFMSETVQMTLEIYSGATLWEIITQEQARCVCRQQWWRRVVVSVTATVRCTI